MKEKNSGGGGLKSLLQKLLNHINSFFKKKGYKITILTDKTSWMNKYNLLLKEKLETMGHRVSLIHSKKELKKGDIAFLLSCFEIVPQKYLDLNKNNIVVHASNLPEGKGWSPSTWQILEGKNEIPLTLFEAANSVDAGDYYLKSTLQLDGFELIDEWQGKLGLKIVEMCVQYVENYGVLKPKKQEGKESFYNKRTKKDSEIDPNKTIKEQFNLLRVTDNEKYPAYFEFGGEKYVLKIYKVPKEERQ